MYYILYYMYNLKKFKVQIIGIFEEMDSLPPSFGQNPKEQQFFFSEERP